MMDFRIILILVCIASSTLSRIATPRRFSTGKSLYCYLSATEGQQTTLEISPMTKERCTHFILNKYTINLPSYRIINSNDSGTLPLIQWKISSRGFLLHTNVKILIDVFLPKLSPDDLNKIPRDLGSTWAKYLKDYKINGIIFRFHDIDYYNGSPFDHHIQRILQNVYEDFHKNDLLLIMEDFTCSISSSVENIQVDFLISNCDIPIKPCVGNEYIETSETNLKFTKLKNISNSKIIREFKIVAQKVITPNNVRSILSYPKICKEIISREKVVENTNYCLKKYSQETGNGIMETILFDDTETVMKKTKYFISYGINGILLRHRNLDDDANDCDPEKKLIVPGTQGRYPLLKAAEIGILLGAINEWMGGTGDRKVSHVKKMEVEKKVTKVNVTQHEKMVICHEIGLERILDVDPSLSSYCTHLMFEEDLDKEECFSVLKTKLESNRSIVSRIWEIKRQTNMKIIFAINVPSGNVASTLNKDNCSSKYKTEFVELLFDSGFNGFCLSLPDYSESDYYLSIYFHLYQFNLLMEALSLTLFVQDRTCIKNSFPDVIELYVDFYIYSCPIEFQKCSEDDFAKNIERNLDYATHRKIPLEKIIIKMSLAENIPNELNNFRDVCNQLDNSVIDTADRCKKETMISSRRGTISLSDAGTLMKQSEYYSYHGVQGIMFDRYRVDDSRGECEALALTEIDGPYPLLQGINKGIVRGDALQKQILQVQICNLPQTYSELRRYLYSC